MLIKEGQGGQGRKEGRNEQLLVMSNAIQIQFKFKTNNIL